MQHIFIDEETIDCVRSVVDHNIRQTAEGYGTFDDHFKLQYKKMLDENSEAASQDPMLYKSDCKVIRDDDCDEKLKKQLRDIDLDCALQKFRRKLPAFKLQKVVNNSILLLLDGININFPCIIGFVSKSLRHYGNIESL